MTKYISQKHSQILLFLFFISSAVFIAFPEIDLQVSGMFYDSRFSQKGSLWEAALHNSVPLFLIITIVSVALLCVYNQFTGKNLCSINVRKAMYLLLVLVIGSGLIVNLALKNNSGRARPVHIAEFNGDKQFTPAFEFSNQCDRNCSFSSGHSSAAFFFLALALLFKYRKTALLLAFSYGCLVSLARIAAGGHFLSDCVVSFFIMAITADILYTLLLDDSRQTDQATDGLTPCPAPASSRDSA